MSIYLIFLPIFASSQNWVFESTVHQKDPLIYGYNAKEFISTFYVKEGDQNSDKYYFTDFQEQLIDTTSLKLALDLYKSSLQLGGKEDDYQIGFRLIYGLNKSGREPELVSYNIECYIAPVVISIVPGLSAVVNLKIEPEINENNPYSIVNITNAMVYKTDPASGRLSLISQDNNEMQRFETLVNNYERYIYQENFLNPGIIIDPLNFLDINNNGVVSTLFPYSIVSEMCKIDNSSTFYATSVSVKSDSSITHSIELCTKSFPELKTLSLDDLKNKIKWPSGTPANFSQLCPTNCNNLKARFLGINDSRQNVFQLQK
jgi:hypothetical protein